MPHITIKMLKGRTDDQKKLAADKVAAALVDAIGCNPEHISVAVEDFTPVEWQDEFRKEVTESEHIYKEPHYDPRTCCNGADSSFCITAAAGTPAADHGRLYGFSGSRRRVPAARVVCTESGTVSGTKKGSCRRQRISE